MKKTLLSLAALLTMMACQPAEQNSETDSLVYKHNKWPNPKQIPVCIMNRQVMNDEMFNDLKNFVVSEYSTKTGINFVGWESCSEVSAAETRIRVHFNPYHDWSRPYSISAGGGLSFLGAVKGDCGDRCNGGTMRIDIGKQDGYPTSGMRNFAVTQTRATMIHEFGHAVGLAHEHDRADAPKCNDMKGRVVNDRTYAFVGDYDPNSIMNYCKNEGVTTLSAGDVAGIQYLYPELNTDGLGNGSNVPEGSVLGEYRMVARNSGHCVDVMAAGLENDAKIQQYTCNGTVAQTFRLRQGAAGSFAIENVNSNKCLEVPRSQLENGSPISQFTCNETQTQRVYLTKMDADYFRIHFAHSNRCLDVGGHSTESGAALIQWDCHGQPNQQFRLERIGG